MTGDATSISLGFTPERFPAGVHICQIYTDERERDEALLKYLESGLLGRERTTCFSDDISPAIVKAHLDAAHISFDEATRSGALTLAQTHDIYFENGRFDPERMLAVLKCYHEDTVAQGYAAARVIGEMSAEVQTVEGGSRLPEYESKVSLLLRKHPVSCVCQYDARKFDGAMIMDVLKVHPMMVIRGTVVRNPFFVPPEEYLRH